MSIELGPEAITDITAKDSDPHKPLILIRSEAVAKFSSLR